MTNPPVPELPRAAWSRPIRHIDTSKITLVPVVKHDHQHAATSRYVDLYWTPLIGAEAVALIRWASHQERPMSMSETQLATVIGAPGVGQVRRAFTKLLNHKLITINGQAITVAITLPTLTKTQANTFGGVFARRHSAELTAVGRVANCARA